MNEGYIQELRAKDNSGCLKGQSAAAEITQFTAVLGKRAQEVADRTNTKLQSVMRDANPSAQTEVVQKEYPPLFAELRNDLLVIEAALNIIESILSRTEL